MDDIGPLIDRRLGKEVQEYRHARGPNGEIDHASNAGLARIDVSPPNIADRGERAHQLVMRPIFPANDRGGHDEGAAMFLIDLGEENLPFFGIKVIDAFDRGDHVIARERNGE